MTVLIFNFLPSSSHYLTLVFYRVVAVQMGPRPPSFEFCISHTITHTQLDSTERVNSWSQRPLPTQHRTNTGIENACPRQDSNQPSQQSIDRRPTPYTPRLPELTFPTQTIYIVFSAPPIFDPTQR